MYSNKLFVLAGILPVQTQSGNLSVSSQLQYNIIQQPYIDETNEEVEDLLDSEMGTVEECIKAIEMYGTASAAVTAMIKNEEKERKEELQFGVGALPRSQEQSIPHQQAFVRLVALDFSRSAVETCGINTYVFERILILEVL